MGHALAVSHALVISSIFCVANTSPISGQDELVENSLNQNLVYLFGTTIAVAICIISLLIVCACWGSTRKVKLQSISSQIELQNQSSPFSTTLSSHLSISDSKIYFEPLPDITPRAHVEKVSVCLAQSENWFAEPYQNFPRNQLQYIRKIGSGWFGNVLEGRAIGIDTDHTSTAIPRLKSDIDCNTVIVKCLREDATIDEQSYFLQELLPYKKLRHANLLRLLSFCLEAQPFLILMEYCAKGVLKCLLQKEAFSDVYLIQMAVGVAEGLAHMHQHNFIHTDLAARNCLVSGDYVVKIGDYGNSIEAYKNEYYLAERIALPLRWCAPDSLNCTETTIETVELTKEANVWSFGVLLWEILSRAKLPYEDLGNDEIIQKVILEKSLQLQSPQQLSNQCDIVEILQACFMPCSARKQMEDVSAMLRQLSSTACNSEEEEEFDKRWQKLSSPSRNNSTEAAPTTSAASDTLSKAVWQPLFTENNNLVCVGSSTKQEAFVPFSPILSSLAAEEQYDSLTPISAAIQTLDEALSASNEAADVKVSSDYDRECDKWTKLLTESEEDFLTKRLEQGDFAELVRMKSRSVQDLMCLTVVDYSSDSSDRASQLGSLPGDPSSLVSEKNFSSESNLKEAMRDNCFMMELERLQGEHRYSIISEVSREDCSLEHRNVLNEFNDPPQQIYAADRSCLQIEENNCKTASIEIPDLCPISPTDNSTMKVPSNDDNFEYFSAISAINRENNDDNSSFHNNQNDSKDVNTDNSISDLQVKPKFHPDINQDTEEIDGGKFWKLQMTAWQEAALETRELLQEAAQFSESKFEDDENLLDSPQKHSETSEEDSETYISYDTTKEDIYPEGGQINQGFGDLNAEFCEINPADIMALRNELSLKLNCTDVSNELEPQEEIFINYRTSRVSLSPIREESLLGEYNSLDDTDVSSVIGGEDHENIIHLITDLDSELENEVVESTNGNDNLGQTSRPESTTCRDISADDATVPVVNTELNSSLVDSGLVDEPKDLVLRTGDTSSKYLYSNVCEPLEPDSGYSNMLGPDSSIGANYQSYFNIGVHNVIQCGTSLEDGSIYDSTDHTSLPYEVNFPDKFLGLDRPNVEWCLASNNTDVSKDRRELVAEDSSYNEANLSADDSELKLKKNVEEANPNGTKEWDDRPVNDNACSAYLVADDVDYDSPDRESDMESSSTSGEFVWMGTQNPSTECSGRASADNHSKVPSDCSEVESDSGEEEFTPSMWNSQLTPKQSLLKSPEMNSSLKKNVHWKQQKHHRVYEYPPEPITWHAEETQQRRTWGGHNLDYLTLADWEFVEEFSVEDPEQLCCTNHTNIVPSIFAPLSFPNDDSMVVDDCDFLIRSAAPFGFKKSAFSPNEYFHSETNAGPPFDERIPLPVNAAPASNAAEQTGAATNSSTHSVGEMRYSKDNLRLNLPPILGADYQSEVLDNQKSQDEFLNNDDCGHYSQ